MQSLSYTGSQLSFAQAPTLLSSIDIRRAGS
jgi:hypothetical protein